MRQTHEWKLCEISGSLRLLYCPWFMSGKPDPSICYQIDIFSPMDVHGMSTLQKQGLPYKAGSRDPQCLHFTIHYTELVIHTWSRLLACTAPPEREGLLNDTNCVGSKSTPVDTYKSKQRPCYIMWIAELVSDSLSTMYRLQEPNGIDFFYIYI